MFRTHTLQNPSTGRLLIQCALQDDGDAVVTETVVSEAPEPVPGASLADAESTDEPRRSSRKKRTRQDVARDEATERARNYIPSCLELVGKAGERKLCGYCKKLGKHRAGQRCRSCIHVTGHIRYGSNKAEQNAYLRLEAARDYESRGGK